MPQNKSTARATTSAIFVAIGLLQGGFTSPARSDAKARLLYVRAGQESKQVATRLQALGHISQALVIEPKNPHFWYTKALILQGMEENEQALPCIDKSLEFDPNSAFAWDAKASILSGLGRNEQALAAANEAVRMEACSSTRMTRAQVLTHMGKFYPAEKELDDIIKADPTNEGARSRRAMVAGHTHHWNKVIEDNTFLIQANKESLVKSTSTTFQDRAAAYINTKQYDKAIADYKTGLKINPDSRPLHSGLLNAYTLSGNTKAAQAERKVLESYDDDITPFK